MKITLAQRRLRAGDVAHNLCVIGTAVRNAEGELVVLGEMALTGYMCRDLFHILAEEEDGPSVRALAGVAAATGKHILLGMPLRGAVRGMMTNSAVLISPDGRTQRYDKNHLANFGPFEEGLYFTPGREGAMLECGGLMLGVVICYDIFHPGLARDYAAAGADAIVCLSSSPVTSRAAFERVLPARAVENATYTLFANQVGTQLNISFFGGSQAHGPRGDPLGRAAYLGEGDVDVVVDRAETELARRTRPTLRDSGLDRARTSGLYALTQ
jgi:predicted amidohydrolase